MHRHNAPLASQCLLRSPHRLLPGCAGPMTYSIGLCRPPNGRSKWKQLPFKPEVASANQKLLPVASSGHSGAFEGQLSGLWAQCDPEVALGAPKKALWHYREHHVSAQDMGSQPTTYWVVTHTKRNTELLCSLLTSRACFCKMIRQNLVSSHPSSCACLLTSSEPSAQS